MNRVVGKVEIQRERKYSEGLRRKPRLASGYRGFWYGWRETEEGLFRPSETIRGWRVSPFLYFRHRILLLAPHLNLQWISILGNCQLSRSRKFCSLILTPFFLPFAPPSQNRVNFSGMIQEFFASYVSLWGLCAVNFKIMSTRIVCVILYIFLYMDNTNCIRRENIILNYTKIYGKV